MSNTPEITEAKMLAHTLIGNAESAVMSASVQRSHRFPLHVISKIENMAKMAGSTTSFMINRTLDAGLEAVFKELPENVRKELSVMTEEQLNQPSKTLVEEVKNKGRNK